MPERQHALSAILARHLWRCLAQALPGVHVNPDFPACVCLSWHHAAPKASAVPPAYKAEPHRQVCEGIKLLALPLTLRQHCTCNKVRRPEWLMLAARSGTTGTDLYDAVLSQRHRCGCTGRTCRMGLCICPCRAGSCGCCRDGSCGRMAIGWMGLAVIRQAQGGNTCLCSAAMAVACVILHEE